MDHETLAGFEPAAHEHVVPDREERLGDGSGLDQRKAARHRQAVAAVGGTVFGVTAAVSERHDPVARFPAFDLAADGNDLARNLQPGQRARVRRHRITAQSLQHVGAIHARRGNANQHLGRAGPGHREIDR